MNLSNGDRQKLEVISRHFGYNIVLDVVYPGTGEAIVSAHLQSGVPWKGAAWIAPSMALHVFLDGMLALIRISDNYRLEVESFLAPLNGEYVEYDDAIALICEAERRYGVSIYTVGARATWDAINFLSEEEERK